MNYCEGQSRESALNSAATAPSGQNTDGLLGFRATVEEHDGGAVDLWKCEVHLLLEGAPKHLRGGEKQGQRKANVEKQLNYCS